MQEPIREVIPKSVTALACIAPGHFEGDLIPVFRAEFSNKPSQE
jgi:hypothetical protein